ncbi:MAG: hypothetical protein C0596_04595 [Marinilabiliales bacterium]|nr:MAG: hypothetical protein C0596_04595 [Marinilabiliales bacterium]
MKKLFVTIVFGFLFCFVIFSQDTVAIAYHESCDLSALIVNTSDEVHICAYNQEGVKIYNRICDLNAEIVDYSLTYFDSGAVETIKVTLENYENESKTVEFYEFDYLGHEVRAKHVTGIDVDIENESESYNFEGGIIFRVNDEDE